MATGVSEPPINCLGILERLGITKTHSQKRIEIYRQAGINSTVFSRRYVGEKIDIIIAGSRGEGTAVSADNVDADILFVQRSVNCFKTFPSKNDKKRYLASFLLDFENVKFGYAMLRLVSFRHTKTGDWFLGNVKDGLVIHNGHKYLRNDRVFTNTLPKHREGINKQPSVFDDITGPAKRVVLAHPLLDDFSADLVQAFPVSYPTMLDRWRQRERKYTWPSKALIQNALSRDVLVVPVGVPGSDQEILQWRLSVTLAEQTLIHSFNDTQIKLFVTVKMIVKHHLKPISDCMSSYLVKNLMFWFNEETEECLFRRECFNELVIDILKRLKRCIYWKYQKNYLLPSINMLDNKIFEIERRNIVQKLDEIIANGCLSALLHCPLVNDMIHMPRNLSKDNLVFRQLTEQMGLAIFSIPASYFDRLLEDNVFHYRLFNMSFEEIIYIIFRYVLPIIRATNPHAKKSV